MSYPADWPRCSACGDFALDGHITCGRVECDEGRQRDQRAANYCGIDGGEHEWVVAYWIGGERDENGEHVICRKCGEEYLR